MNTQKIKIDDEARHKSSLWYNLPILWQRLVLFIGVMLIGGLGIHWALGKYERKLRFETYHACRQYQAEHLEQNPSLPQAEVQWRAEYVRRYC